MTLLVLSPFLAQALLMVVDEFWYHRRRGLGRWERWGHPLDSLTLIACFLWLASKPVRGEGIAVYLGLGLFSCLFVTKDELVHAHSCEPGEHWLHAVLFVLHPIVLGAAAAIRWIPELSGLAPAVYGQTALMGLFTVHQVVYWNLLRDRVHVNAGP